MITQYAYDGRGRLVEARRDGRLTEEYAYDAAGRRVMSRSEALGMVRLELQYQDDKLRRMGGVGFWYGPDGTLSVRRDPQRGTTYFTYGPHGGLIRAQLPGGATVRWERNATGQPLSSTLDGHLAERWTWHDLLRLARYEDLRRGLTMDFHYAGKARIPKAMTLRDGRETCLFALGCDQVGSITTVANDAGDLVKTILYDAFGNVVDDSAPHFFLPLTFAGGAQDRWTGLIRFGHRDDDPQSGRFTARDPSHSPEGDPDTYEYCIDDPVNRIDSQGLESELAELPAPGPLDEDLEKAFDPADGAHYWTVIPEATACAKCRALAGRVFRKEPKRPPPNCKCLIQKHTAIARQRHIVGKLYGFDDRVTHRFQAKGQVMVSMRNAGPGLLSGVYVEIKNGKTFAKMFPIGSAIKEHIGNIDTKQMDYELSIHVRAGDNSLVLYEIEYKTQ